MLLSVDFSFSSFSWFFMWRAFQLKPQHFGYYVIRLQVWLKSSIIAGLCWHCKKQAKMGTALFLPGAYGRVKEAETPHSASTDTRWVEFSISLGLCSYQPGWNEDSSLLYPTWHHYHQVRWNSWLTLLGFLWHHPSRKGDGCVCYHSTEMRLPAPHVAFSDTTQQSVTSIQLLRVKV